MDTGKNRIVGKNTKRALKSTLFAVLLSASLIAPHILHIKGKPHRIGQPGEKSGAGAGQNLFYGILAIGNQKIQHQQKK